MRDRLAGLACSQIETVDDLGRSTAGTLHAPGLIARLLRYVWQGGAVAVGEVSHFARQRLRLATAHLEAPCRKIPAIDQETVMRRGRAMIDCYSD
jgi:hypothetical protein